MVVFDFSRNMVKLITWRCLLTTKLMVQFLYCIITLVSKNNYSMLLLISTISDYCEFCFNSYLLVVRSSSICFGRIWLKIQRRVFLYL